MDPIPAAIRRVMFSAEDHSYMARALALAEKGLYTTSPNPRVGCVIVKNGVVLGEGFTQPAGQNHAEIEALADAHARRHDVAGATVYVSLEPCSHFGRTPPCVNALTNASVARVIAAMEDPNPRVSGKGLETLREAGIEVRCGLLEREARELNIGFVSRMTRGRPWVRMKAAASLDGRSALSDGTSQWITGEAARLDGHAWRARSCAILTGVGTVRSDDPRLTVRDIEGSRQPKRIVVDSRLEIPMESQLVRSAALGGVLIAYAVGNDAKEAELAERGCELLHVLGNGAKVNLPALMLELGRREFNEVHVEAGSRLNGSLIREHCVDELLVYIAPTLLGAAQPMFALEEVPSLGERWQLEFFDLQMLGADIRVRGRMTAAPSNQES